MNRTDRLYALVEELRGRAPAVVRASELARRFEVSIRTIERDLLALQEAGVPIWAQPGPGGGYGLHVETTLPPLNLTPAEAAAIATALAATRAMPFAEAGHSALAKVTAVMATRSKDTTAQLVSRIRVAPGPEGPLNAVTEVIQRALLQSVALDLSYRDRQGCGTTRVVEPIGILGTHGGWFLVAWCRLRQAPRVFRFDRIQEIQLTTEPIILRPLDTALPDLPFAVAEPTIR